MGVYATTAFVLFCLMSTMDQSYSFHLSRNCEDVSKSCGKVIDVFMSKRGNATNLDLDAVCQSTEEHLECYGDCQQEIHDMPVIGLGMKLNDYFCDPTRRDEVKALLSQDCVRDGSMDNEMDDVMDTCMDNAMNGKNKDVIIEVFWIGDQSRASTLCPTVNQAMSCFANAINKNCGSDVMPVVRDILRIVFTDLVTVFLPPCLSQLE